VSSAVSAESWVWVKPIRVRRSAKAASVGAKTVGHAVTVVCEPGKAAHKQGHPDAVSQYLRDVAAQPGPKIVDVQDLDKPRVLGS
jgi:hypothetical protein